MRQHRGQVSFRPSIHGALARLRDASRERLLRNVSKLLLLRRTTDQIVSRTAQQNHAPTAFRATSIQGGVFQRIEARSDVGSAALQTGLRTHQRVTHVRQSHVGNQNHRRFRQLQNMPHFVPAVDAARRHRAIPSTRRLVQTQDRHQGLGL